MNVSAPEFAAYQSKSGHSEPPMPACLILPCSWGGGVFRPDKKSSRILWNIPFCRQSGGSSNSQSHPAGACHTRIRPGVFWNRGQLEIRVSVAFTPIGLSLHGLKISWGVGPTFRSGIGVIYFPAFISVRAVCRFVNLVAESVPSVEIRILAAYRPCIFPCYLLLSFTCHFESHSVELVLISTS